MTTQIAIIGYHRSGTSAISQHFQAAGLFLGEDLLGTKPTNPFGHYEDREFFEINEAVLQLNFDRWDMVSDFMPVITPDCVRLALDMVAKRNAEFALWGFKDPRTCVLLDFWHSVLPNPKYLVCLRHYTACIDSVLRRRQRDYFGYNDVRLAHSMAPYALNFEAACANWCVYMATVLKFLTFRRPDALVVRIDTLDGSASVAGMMAEKFDLPLQPVPLDRTFRHELFQAEALPDLPVGKELRDIAEDLWGRLLDFVDETATMDRDRGNG